MVHCLVAEGLLLMTPIEQAKKDMAIIMLKMMKVVMMLAAHREEIDDSMAVLLGLAMMTIRSNAEIAMRIIENPTTIQPPAGRRCIFY